MKAVKILVVAPAWIGDSVMAHALLRLLKSNNPEVLIDVLAPKSCAAMMEIMPEVDRVIVSPFAHGELRLLERIRLGRKLRENNYSQAIVLPNSFKSALIPFFAKIPVRTGWRGEWRYGLLNDIRVLNKAKYPLMVDRFLALGVSAGDVLPSMAFKPKIAVPKDQVAAVNQELAVAITKPILAMCPGAAFGVAKRWPASYFAQVAQKKIEQGWDVWLFGATAEVELAAQIQQYTNNRCVDFTARTSLAQAVALMSQASLVLTNDSGLMHIAAALERPLLVLYGSSSPGFTPPLCDQAKIVSLGLACGPCFKRECPLEHFKCMLDLHPEKVIEQLEAF